MNQNTTTYSFFRNGLIAMLFGLGIQATAQPERPNILLIVADDHRSDLIGKYHDIIKTPALDALCDRGMIFKNAYATTPICAASRASILTGVTERTHGYTFGQPPVPASFVASSYPQQLKSNGYRTGFIGKFGFKMKGDSADLFNVYDDRKQAITERYQGKEIPQTHYIANVACDFIEEAAHEHANQPWCLSVSFWNPHAHDQDTELQYHYPAEFDQLYNDVTIPPARLSDDASFNALPPFIKESMSRIRWAWRYDTPEKYQMMVKRHYRAISAVDQGVQKIREKLAEHQLANNTVIIYIGDNGYTINERQLAGKWLGWNECLNVPLIIADPRIKAHHGKECQKMALNIDLAPTVCELAGIVVPSTYQGKSLLPLLQEKDPDWRSEFFFEHYYTAKGKIPRMEGIQTKAWKYVKFTETGFEQLYDLRNDSGETTNLATTPSFANELSKLRSKTADYVSRYEAPHSDLKHQ